MQLRITLLLSCLASTLAASPGMAELHVADVFTHHAVLQQGVELPVWGFTTAGKTVTVQFSGHITSAKADAEGRWEVRLPPLRANSLGESMIVTTDGQRKELRDLLVGEVWYASGQSNMQMTLNACARKLPAIGKLVESHQPDSVRVLRIDQPDSPHPLLRRQKPTSWRTGSADNLGRNSAVAYFFARRLHKELTVPIGIIDGSWGGKPIEGFIPKTQFSQHELLREILSLTEQNKFEELAALPGGVIIRNTAGRPGRIFNARVAPIAPYAIRGFIWYQGESNAGKGEDPRNYRVKVQALAEGWRQRWGQPDLPLVLVQLPSFKDEASGWIRLREEQRLGLAVDQTGMAVTIDLRDADIHPANKVDVGRRLALWALANTYGIDVPFSGPLYRSATIEGSQIRIEFEYADDGLMIARKEGLAVVKETPNVQLAHFEIADSTGEWYSAVASIDGPFVRVKSPKVKEPSAVRYACSGAPANANLYNKAGLPASPFCSDLSLLPWERSK